MAKDSFLPSNQLCYFIYYSVTAYVLYLRFLFTYARDFNITCVYRVYRRVFALEFYDKSCGVVITLHDNIDQ